MYLETSSPAKQGDRAWFMSDVIVARSACLIFFYHMYGTNIGELKIYQLHRAGQGNVIQLWEKKGTSICYNVNVFKSVILKFSVIFFIRVTGDQGDEWREAQVTLPYVPGETFRVLIEGVVGNGFKGDIAVDDIKYIPEACKNGGTNRDMKSY